MGPRRRTSSRLALAFRSCDAAARDRRYRIARLPRWLSLARRRDEVLRGLARLRRMLPTHS